MREIKKIADGVLWCVDTVGSMNTNKRCWPWKHKWHYVGSEGENILLPYNVLRYRCLICYRVRDVWA